MFLFFLFIISMIFPGMHGYLITNQGLSTPQSYLYPWSIPQSPATLLIPSSRVICSACSCDDDFFCSWNCPKCKTEEFCSTCKCLSSLGCARNCQTCSVNSDSSVSDISSSSSDGCIASSGPAAGRSCIFPFIYNGVRYDACAPLNGGIANTYSQVYWCSTKVDINGFHVRGSWNNQGKYVGFCDDSCPKVSGTYYWFK